MNKTIPEIAESCDQLLDKMRAAKEGYKKQRLQALYLLNSGQAKTRSQVAKLLGVHRDTVGRWLTAYQEGGLSKMLSRRFATGKAPLLSAEQLASLKQHLPDGFPSYKAIQHFIRTEYGVEMSYKAVYTLVHDNWKAKLKVPRKSHKKNSDIQTRFL